MVKETKPVADAELPPAAVDLGATIDRWFAEHFQQPPVAHYTDCYNQALAAKDRLKKLLAVR